MNSDQERFLIVPFGLLYSEVTASSLVRIIVFFEHQNFLKTTKLTAFFNLRVGCKISLKSHLVVVIKSLCAMPYR